MKTKKEIEDQLKLVQAEQKRNRVYREPSERTDGYADALEWCLATSTQQQSREVNNGK
jgi:hypothetical protein